MKTKPLAPIPPTEADGNMMAVGAKVLHEFMEENFDHFEWGENEAEVLASVIYRAMASAIAE